VNEVLILDVLLLTLALVAAVAIVRVRSLLAATMLSGIYSLLMALVWSNMHALDVGFTEAAVGAGATTVLLLGTISATGRLSRRTPSLDLRAAAVVLFTGGLLIYGTLDMPDFGDPHAPIHQHRVPKLLAQQVGKVPGRPPLGMDPPDPAHPHPRDDFNGHVPNTVTSLLAAYRGFDTMFETAVIFTAGISLVLLLRRRDDDIVEAWDERERERDVQTPRPVAPVPQPPTRSYTAVGASAEPDDAPKGET
jgi:multicomponent Na+:H+ antiporter subunit B